MNLTAERVRQLRGLLTHGKRAMPHILGSRTFTRGLIGPLGRPQREPGICRWCGRPACTARRRWHVTCISTYRLALGSVIGPDGAPVLPMEDCPCGNPGMELDHRDALSLAWVSGDPRRILRAHTMGNLQWLCRECHAGKTREDMRELRETRQNQVCLVAVHETSTQRVWQTLEGVRIYPSHHQNSLLFCDWERKLRGTFDPRAVSCPRCIHRMSQGDTEGQQDWRLDDQAILSGMTLDEWLRSRDLRMEPLPGLFKTG